MPTAVSTANGMNVSRTSDGYSQLSTTSAISPLPSNILDGHASAQTLCGEPLQYSGSLDGYQSKDITPVIGREFSDLQIRELLKHPNCRQLIKDLAITISQRGVVFLRNQNVTPIEMRELAELISSLSGSPKSSTLHIHPLTEESSELGDQISVISSKKQAKGGGLTHKQSDHSRLASVGWHADITFEPIPSDYAMLKIHTLPLTGGDTLWSSGYEIYSRLSPSMQAFLATLTATHDAKFFHDEARRLGQPLRTGIRGHPLNIGDNLEATHPLIRTNPVTGWNSVFVNKGFTRRINGVTKDESDMLLKYLFDLVVHNHDAQVRFKWEMNDLAIWDNRSNWHCATYDYEAERAGDRVCSLGEAPFFDPNAKSRRDALADGTTQIA